MTSQELMNKVDSILEESRAGILATVDEDGHPRMRWLTPIVLRNRPGVVYSFTMAKSLKTKHINKFSDVEWIFQTRTLTEVVNLSGKAKIVTDPALKSELLEIIGNKLNVFFKANPNKDDFVVLMTVIDSGTYFKPMKARRETVKFI
jgi:pyridoxamine 5'-phosphate oxidase